MVLKRMDDAIPDQNRVHAVVEGVGVAQDGTSASLTAPNGRAQEKLLETEIAKQRIDVQKAVADDKLDVALQRLDQQAELKLLDMQNKNRGA